jgi:hypothetical protein
MAGPFDSVRAVAGPGAKLGEPRLQLVDGEPGVLGRLHSEVRRLEHGEELHALEHLQVA